MLKYRVPNFGNSSNKRIIKFYINWYFLTIPCLELVN